MYFLVEFCRLCLSMKGEFSNMWLDDIMEKVAACITELDLENSDLPLLICSSCMEKMDEFFEFRNQCLQSEFFITGFVNKLLNDSQGYKPIVNSVLKVDVVKDFGSLRKFKANVRLRKGVGPHEEIYSKKCSVDLKPLSSPISASNSIVAPHKEFHTKECSFNLKPPPKPVGASNAIDSGFLPAETTISGEDTSISERNTQILLDIKADIQQHIIDDNLEIKPDFPPCIPDLGTEKKLDVSLTNSAVSSQDFGQSSFIINSLPNEIINLDEDDVFIEEEDAYSVEEFDYEDRSSTMAECTESMASKDTPENILENESAIVHDPEHLLVENGQERLLVDLVTDVSERVKLRRRNAQIKPGDRLSNIYCEKSNKGLAKKSTAGRKKNQTKRSMSNEQSVELRCEENEALNPPVVAVKLDNCKTASLQAKKSVSIKSALGKKNKVKISSGSRNLWKAACRNWALQRMQTSGRITTGSKTLSHTVVVSDNSKQSRDLDSLSNAVQCNKTLKSASLMVATGVEYPEHTDVSLNQNNSSLQSSPSLETPKSTQVTVTTKIGCQESKNNLNKIVTETNYDSTCQDGIENIPNFPFDKTVQLPRIKSVEELNDLLELQNQRFNEEISNQYGIVIADHNYSDLSAEHEEEPNWNAFEEVGFDTKDFKFPQILNTFSLSGESICNPIDTKTDKFCDNIDIENYEFYELPKKAITTKANACNEQVEVSDFNQTKNTGAQQFLYAQPIISSIESNTDFVVDTNPFKKIPKVRNPHTGHTFENVKSDVSNNSSKKLPFLKKVEQQDSKNDTTPQTVPDYDGAIAAHYIDNSATTNNSVPISSSKILLNPQSILKSSMPHTQYKIKTTNNIILIDGNKISTEEQKLYKSNFGNILQHYMKNSSDPVDKQSTSHHFRPVKAVSPRKRSTPTKRGIELERCNVLTSKINSAVPLRQDFPLDQHTMEVKESCSNSNAVLQINASEPSLVKPVEAEISTPKLKLPNVQTTNTIAFKSEKEDFELVLIDESPSQKSYRIIDSKSCSSLVTESIPTSKVVCKFPVTTVPSSTFTSSTKELNSNSSLINLLTKKSDFYHNLQSPEVEKLHAIPSNSVFLQNSAKRRCNSDDTSSSPKSMRLSSEEYDVLIIDDSIDKTPNELTIESAMSPYAKEHFTPQIGDFGQSNHSLSLPTDTIAVGTKFTTSLNVAPGNQALASMKNTESEDRLRHFADMSKAGLLCGSDKVVTAINKTNVKTTNKAVVLPNSSNFSLSDELSTTFEDLMERLASPPVSPKTLHTSPSHLKRRLRARVVVDTEISPRNSPAHTKMTDDSDCDKFNFLLSQPCLKQDNRHSLESVSTASQQLLESVLKSISDSESSNSDSSYIDVEAVSDDDNTDDFNYAPPICYDLDSEKAIHGSAERVRRQNLRKDFNVLYNVIDRSYLEGRSVNAVLKSAKGFIDSLQLRSNKLKSEYNYLITKHAYLLQTVGKLKKM